MGRDEADDWLMVAAGEVEDLPADILDTACRVARRTCTHHAQIIPAVRKEAEPLLDWRRRKHAEPPVRLALPECREPVEQPRGDPNAMASAFQRMGLNAGWLIERDGKLEWTA